MANEPAAAPAKTTDDNFAAAFEQLAAMGDKPVTQAAFNDILAEEAEPAKTPEQIAAEAAEAAKTPPVVTELEGGEGHEKTEEKVEEKTEEKPPAPKPLAEDPLLERFTQIAREAVSAQDRQQREAPPVQQQPQTQPEIYTAEDKQILADFEKDYPDIARASALQRKAEYRDMLNYVFSEVQKRYDPLMPLVQTIAERTHLKDLETATPDYNDVRDKVIDWANAQPAYLQAAYHHVINNGTVEEVADLINRYKSATGSTIAPKATPAPPQKVETELQNKAKKAALALAPVISKRTTATATTPPEDFDGAFAEAAAKAAMAD